MRFLGLVGFTTFLAVGCGDDGGKPDPALETTLDSQPATLTNQPLAVFTFHSDPAGDQFVCQLDGGDPVQCHSPFSSSVAEGAHTFAVATLGAHATLDPTPAMTAWTVDLTPPDTTITSAPPAVDNTVAPTFEFTGSDPNSAVVTFECALDGDPFVACVEPFQITVTDGNHNFAVRAVDLAGNVDPSPASHDWIVDSSTPDTMITAGPANGTTTGGSTSFAFGSATTGATFECRMDGGTFAACATPRSIGPLAGGSHTFAVRAIDVNLIVDPTPALRTWTVDVTPPDVTITQKPADPDNDATPDFGFSSTDATATFGCRIDGATVVACTSVWTSAMLADGSHTFDVRATDPYGNFADATYTWVLDTAAPTVTITSGPQDPPGTKNASPSFTFSTAGSPTVVECSLDGAAFATCSSPIAFTSLADATHVLAVHATDAAGNQGSAMRTFTVDTMAPTIAFTATPTTPGNDPTPTWAFTVAGGPATTTCQIDAGAIAACTSPFTSGTLSNATHTLTVRATDDVGNTGTATSTVTIDTVAPTVAITSGPVDPTPTQNPTPSFAFTVAGGPATTTCTIDSGTAAACTSPFMAAALLDGAHLLTVVATDTAGNAGQATRAFTVDTTAPSVTITSGPADPTPTNDKTPTFTFTVTGGPATTTCEIDAGAAASCTSPFTTAALPDGAHTLTVVATDTAGNTDTAMRAFTIDTIVPVVAFTGGPENPTVTTDPTPTFTFTVTGGPLASTTCKLDAGAAASCTSPFTTAALPDGAHTLTVVATDTAGNAGSASRAFTIDATAPALAFDDVPPGSWPVDYYDMAFHAGEAGVTFTCSLNGAAFTPCTSPDPITTSYGTLSTFAVTGADAAGNTTTISTSWTSQVGLVLHYPWEQAKLANTSLLAQRAAYSPDGAGSQNAVGGWAGTALGSPTANPYKGTQRPLSSSPDGAYTASIWLRPSSGSSGILWSTVDAANGGLEVSLIDGTIFVTLYDSSGNTTKAVAGIALDRWTQVAIRTFGPDQGIDLFLDGGFASSIAPGAGNGFGAMQSKNLVVGNLTAADVDDLRFYNVSFADVEMCTTVARGLSLGTNQCAPLAPLIEFDFERNYTDTGTWPMSVQPPQAGTFVNFDKLGHGLSVEASSKFAVAGFAELATTVPTHSISFWFDGLAPMTLFDFTYQCGTLAPLMCGMRAQWTSAKQIQLDSFNSSLAPKTLLIDLDAALHGVVITEQKASDNLTAQLTVYVDGSLAGTLDLGGSYDAFGSPSDQIVFASEAGALVDEIEFWGQDLSTDKEMLCENGFDGQYDPSSGVCLLTSN